MAINTIATVVIVFTNKFIFSTPSLRLLQLSFATFHFLTTYLTLFLLSRPCCLQLFAPRSISLRDTLPLSIAMSLNVILPNLSLAFSSVTFYQIARILLTPTVAVMNYLLYRSTLPARAVWALVPACVGVGMVSYYDTLPASGSASTADQKQVVETTQPLGILFSLLGIFASSLYTIWIAHYHRKLGNISTMQLLYNQAPVAAFLLLYVIPFVDVFPSNSSGKIDEAVVPAEKWVLILLSGLWASLINISQFFIVARTGPVSSTVVGHVKTCMIVALGWMMGGRVVTDRAVLGVLVAVGGIVAYSVVMLKEQEKTKEREAAPVQNS
ncbi:triose-phosphate transporter family-domain-containing protein [Sordaria brevicollis]|uniref:GDP-mannose transporter n=1 Tax=Sordaria brevicollis TaxID=83679 RepID=A0AAE0UCW1_SORBR|nr:triose-phosphate transporter family-domain-containing protein [Sordaria brevicollis]